MEQHKQFTTSNNLPPRFNPEAILARQRFMKRIMKLTTNILKWRRYTKERDGIGAIVTGLADVLLSVAQGGWEVGGEEVSREVRSIFDLWYGRTDDLSA